MTFGLTIIKDPRVLAEAYFNNYGKATSIIFVVGIEFVFLPWVTEHHARFKLWNRWSWRSLWRKVLAVVGVAVVTPIILEITPMNAWINGLEHADTVRMAILFVAILACFCAKFLATMPLLRQNTVDGVSRS